MLKYAVFLLLIFVLSVPLRAQNDPIKMTPELAYAFPVTKSGPHDVTVKFPILINPAVVIKPGMVLRVIYLPPEQIDDSADLVVAHKGNMEQAYSRSGAADDSGKAKMPTELAHALEGFRRTVWEVPLNFQLALAQFPTDQMHMIYSPTGKSQDLVDQKFSFFEGLFIGLPDGKVTVLAVENKSKADMSGFKAGDQIIAIGGVPIPNDLDAFSKAFSAAKEEAKESHASSFAFTVRSSGKSETHPLNLALPPTIKSSLMDGF